MSGPSRPSRRLNLKLPDDVAAVLGPPAGAPEEPASGIGAPAAAQGADPLTVAAPAAPPAAAPVSDSLEPPVLPAVSAAAGPLAPAVLPTPPTAAPASGSPTPAAPAAPPAAAPAPGSPAPVTAWVPSASAPASDPLTPPALPAPAPARETRPAAASADVSAPLAKAEPGPAPWQPGLAAASAPPQQQPAGANFSAAAPPSTPSAGPALWHQARGAAAAEAQSPAGASAGAPGGAADAPPAPAMWYPVQGPARPAFEAPPARPGRSGDTWAGGAQGQSPYTLPPLDAPAGEGAGVRRWLESPSESAWQMQKPVTEPAAQRRSSGLGVPSLDIVPRGETLEPIPVPPDDAPKGKTPRKRRLSLTSATHDQAPKPTELVVKVPPAQLPLSRIWYLRQVERVLLLAALLFLGYHLGDRVLPQPVANLRATPHGGAPLVRCYPPKFKCAVLVRWADGWWKVRMTDGNTGWVRSWEYDWRTYQERLVLARSASLRAAASESGRRVGPVVRGSWVELLGASHEWARVRVPGGPTGWVRRDDLSPRGRQWQAATPRFGSRVSEGGRNLARWTAARWRSLIHWVRIAFSASPEVWPADPTAPHRLTGPSRYPRRGVLASRGSTGTGRRRPR